MLLSRVGLAKLSPVACDPVGHGGGFGPGPELAVDPHEREKPPPKMAGIDQSAVFNNSLRFTIKISLKIEVADARQSIPARKTNPSMQVDLTERHQMTFQFNVGPEGSGGRLARCPLLVNTKDSVIIYVAGDGWRRYEETYAKQSIF